MSFKDRIKQNTVKQPVVLLYSRYGGGKTTFFAQSPNNIFISLERGMGGNIVNCIDDIKDYDDFISILQSIIDEPTTEQCLTIDSFTSLESMIEASVIKDVTAHNNRVPASVIDNSFQELNFQKGYVLMAKKFEKVMSLLLEIKEKKNIRCQIICHSENKVSKLDPYDPEGIVTTQPLLNPNCYKVVMKDCDVVMFLDENKNTRSAGDGNKKVVVSETKVLRFNDARSETKVRDGYFRKDLVEKGIDIKNFSVDNKDDMYRRFDALFVPEVRLFGGKEKNE